MQVTGGHHSVAKGNEQFPVQRLWLLAGAACCPKSAGGLKP